MKYVKKIYRKDGVRGKWGIDTRKYDPIIHRFLEENPHIKDIADDDRLLLIIFQQFQREVKYYEKYVWDPIEDEVVLEEDVFINRNKIDWKCIQCEQPLTVILNDTSMENLVCDDCKPTFKKNIKKKTLLNLNKFRKKCSYIISRRKQSIEYWMQRNSKRLFS